MISFYSFSDPPFVGRIVLAQRGCSDTEWRRVNSAEAETTRPTLTNASIDEIPPSLPFTKGGRFCSYFIKFPPLVKGRLGGI
jgi:hypothetical protein